jgi:hypothetical protein
MQKQKTAADDPAAVSSWRGAIEIDAEALETGADYSLP